MTNVTKIKELGLNKIIKKKSIFIFIVQKINLKTKSKTKKITISTSVPFKC